MGVADFECKCHDHMTSCDIVHDHMTSCDIVRDHMTCDIV